MRAVIVPIVFLSALCIGTAFSEEERQSRPRREALKSLSLINPNYTDITEHAYTAALLKDNSLLGGGVIVAKQWVLTAAYNTDGYLASQLKVRIGSNDPTSGGRQYKVTKKIQHPKYYGNWTFDLTLLKLGSAINAKYGEVISLATSQYTGSSTAIITGFGATHKLAGVASAQLQVATLQMFDYEECDQDWYGTELSAGEICGFTPGVGPCWSDFGDPVVECGDSCTLIGIFAGSYGCADDQYPGIYMDIGYFYDWISNYTT